MKEKRGFLGRIDRSIFLNSAVIIIVFVLWALIWPKPAGNTFNTVQKFLTTYFGWSYLLIVTGFVLFACQQDPLNLQALRNT